MTDNTQTADVAVDMGNVHRLTARAFTALRIFTGLVWLSNALAKIFDVGNYDWGLFLLFRSCCWPSCPPDGCLASTSISPPGSTADGRSNRPADTRGSINERGQH
jgi:hypothetical protein